MKKESEKNGNIESKTGKKIKAGVKRKSDASDSSDPVKIAKKEEVFSDSIVIKTEDSSSSSDSDFEEVSSQYRTPDNSAMTSNLSDSGVCRKLENSFSDLEAVDPDTSKPESKVSVSSFQSKHVGADSSRGVSKRSSSTQPKVKKESLKKVKNEKCSSQEGTGKGRKNSSGTESKPASEKRKKLQKKCKVSVCLISYMYINKDLRRKT